jgi:flagellin
MERLSTGKLINASSNDAAGVAISSRLSVEILGANQAIRNSMDGQALIDTAEGAHKEIENILQRMREVAVQAANDTNNAQDRGNLQAEMAAMPTEIGRIAGTTTWADANLMEDATTDFSFQVGAAAGTKNQITIDIKSMNTTALVHLFGCSGEDAQSLLFPISRLLINPERFADDELEPMTAVGMRCLYSKTYDGKKLKMLFQ